MKRILLLRHGIAEPRTVLRPDASRVLTEAGRAKLDSVLRRAYAAGVRPDLILSSPLRRALQTAQLAAELLRCLDLRQTPALKPASTARQVLEELGCHSAASILLAGHEPLLSATAAALLGAPQLRIEFKKGALLCIEDGTLQWMLTAKLASL